MVRLSQSEPLLMERQMLRSKALSLLPPPEICRELRERAGVSQIAVAQMCDVHQAAVSRWENGRQPEGEAAYLYYRVIERLKEFKLDLEQTLC